MQREHMWHFSPGKAAAYVRQNARQILILAFLALLVHDIFGAHGFIAMRRTQKEIQQIRQQIGKLNDENKSLNEQVTSLKTDPKAIERIAREEMGLARPGEMIYKIPESAKPGDTRTPDGQKSVPRNKFPQKPDVPAHFFIHFAFRKTMARVPLAAPAPMKVKSTPALRAGKTP
jgi:cell division protein FtsB